MKTIFYKNILLFLGLVVFSSIAIIPPIALAEEKADNNVTLNYGADAVSRYIWRGLELGSKANIPHFQPNLGASYETEKAGTFNFSIWSSFGISSDYIETDLILGYELSTPSGTIGVAITDFIFPSNKKNFFNFDNHGEGAHTCEVALSYAYIESFPLKLTLASNVYNDIEDDNSLYAEASFPFEIATVSFNTFAGLTKGPSIYYGVADNTLQCINSGISASKNIEFSESISITAGIDCIYNPYIDKGFVVFKLSYRGE